MITTGYLPDPERWHLWNDTLALLDLAAKRGGCAAWEQGDLLWIALDGSHVIGAVTSRMLADGRAEVKHIAGKQPGRWLGQIDAQIEDWARAHRAPRMISRGRKGWQPMVEAWGWRVVGSDNGLTLYEKEL